MQVEIVRGPTRHKVLSEARRRLGPDPLVLTVRRQPNGAGDGFEWEAIVARETPEPPRAPPVADERVASTLGEVERLSAALARYATPAKGDTSTQDLLALARRLTQLEHDLLTSVLGHEALPKSWLPWLERLEGAGYPRAEALKLIHRLETERAALGQREGEDHYRQLRSALAGTVAVAPAEERVRPGLVIFTGGAGVGKTTLSAKLAADLCLGGAKKPVIGVLLPRKGVGVETVRRCARALDIDFLEVHDAAELAKVAEVAESRPVVLDSASVNPLFEPGLRALGRVLEAAPTAEIHAVVPASYSLQDFGTATRAFGFVGAKRLSVTRLDEAPFVGRVLAAATAACWPIGYISQGPRIPDDLVRPGLESLLDAVFRREALGSA